MPLAVAGRQAAVDSLLCCADPRHRIHYFPFGHLVRCCYVLQAIVILGVLLAEARDGWNSQVFRRRRVGYRYARQLEISVIGFLHSLLNNPRLVAAFPQGPDVGCVQRNVREAGICCALGLVMFAYLAAFVPHQHWDRGIKPEVGATPLISQASEAGAAPDAADDITSSIPETSDTGVTPLISEASANRPNAVRYWLARGVSRYAKTNEGFTAFDFAAYNKNELLARRLWTRLSAMSDTALKATMDESYSEVSWSVCQFLLSQLPQQDPSPRNVLQIDLRVETSSLSPQERISRCSEWTSRNRIPHRRNALPFNKASSVY
jgi:hypothetical protein